MSQAAASLNTSAYRRELSTVGTTSGEPPGTPYGPRAISPTALTAAMTVRTADVRCRFRRLL